MLHTIGMQRNFQYSIKVFCSKEGKYIEWFGDNDLANEFAMIGMRHFMNAEQEKALLF